MKSLIAAFQFLTIFPIPTSFNIQGDHLKKSIWFFPVVGIFLGLLLVLFDFFMMKIFPQKVVSTLDLILMVFVSGAFHLDGLADSADGLLSSRPKERILEIMKDGRSGPMAIAVVLFLLLLKLACISSLPIGNERYFALFFAPFIGRCSLVWMFDFLPYAREEGGLASIFLDGKNLYRSLFLLVGIIFSLSFFISWGSLCLFLFLSWPFMFFLKRKIGGFTGDTLGAFCELQEAIILLIFLI